jgi:hypothetical protein
MSSAKNKGGVMKAPLIVLAAVAIVAAAFSSTASAAGQPDRLPGFRSPTGNIRCLYVPGRPSLFLCSLARANYAKQLQARCLGPSRSGVDWHGFSLGPTTRGKVLCTGGILYNPIQRPTYVTLPYAKTWRRGAFTCSSRVTGVTCRNPKGHGLFVSRESWKVW